MKSIKQLFAEHEKTFSALDAKGLAQFFAGNCGKTSKSDMVVLKYIRKTIENHEG